MRNFRTIFVLYSGEEFEDKHEVEKILHLFPANIKQIILLKSQELDWGDNDWNFPLFKVYQNGDIKLF